MAKAGTKVKIEAKNAGTRKVLEELIRAEEGFNLINPADTARADLIIFELGVDIEKDFQVIESLSDLNTVGEIFLISKHFGPELLLKAMRSGAKEFFSHPIKKEEITQALVRHLERVEKPKTEKTEKAGRIVQVIGSKGGVGTTSVAVNLAVCLAEKKSGQSVAILDTKILYGEVPLFLEIKPSYHWGEITDNISRLDTTFLLNILSRHSTGVYVLPSPAYLNSHKPATPRTMEHLLALMQGMFDFIVVDGGQPLDETCLRVIELSDTVLLVSTLSLQCLANTNKLLKSFHALGYPTKNRLKVIINRYHKNTEISLRDAEAGIERKVFWTIPNDYRTSLSSINQGKPFSQSSSKTAIAKSINELAESLLKGEKNKAKSGWKLFRRG